RDDRGTQLARQALERPGYEADLRLAVLRVPRRLQQLEIIDHEQGNVVLRLEPARLGPQLQQVHRRSIVDPDLGGAEQAGGARELGEVVVPQVSGADPGEVDK